ncbi:MAG: glycosyltransferase family 2 protein [Nitrospina sp.]|nr:glycosyltransferase family 2 protein [Nitrospina sp.]MBT6718845.1 glycosyltransferase family 2 protein [Nitrospina sp.]
MQISIIVPTFNEARCLSETLTQIQQLSPHQLIVSDGGSNDNTIEIAKNFTEFVIKGPSGRAPQMNAGAQIATGNIFLFLHADSRIEPASYKKMLHSMKNPEKIGGAFSLCIDSEKWSLKLITRLANIRSKYLGMAYGDQAFFVKSSIFHQMSGFTELPICEDIDFFKRLKKLGSVVLLKEKALTSPRRWTKEGIWFTTLRNILIATLFKLGFPPRILTKWYQIIR